MLYIVVHMMKESGSTDAQIASTSRAKWLRRTRPDGSPNLPCQDLLIHNDSNAGNHPVNYQDIRVRLYEASLNCDWKTAEDILGKHQELLWHSLTGNGETALHIAASVTKSKQVESFVKNLVDMMEAEDLALQNKNYDTALYMAATAGNINTVRIMVEKNRTLTTIPGHGRKILPLNVAALYGNYEVVKYLYENSNNLCAGDGWNDEKRASLLEKCVEGDMFDIALEIYKNHKRDVYQNVLGILAQKPDAFVETKSSIIKIKRSITSVFSFAGLKDGAPGKKINALTLLNSICGENMTIEEIEYLLQGPKDTIEQDLKTISGRAIQAVQLQKIIYEHVAKMKEEINNIITRSPDRTNKNTKKASDEEQVLRLRNIVSEHLVTMHNETQKMTKGPPEPIKQDNILDSGEEDLVLKLQNLIFQHIARMLDKTRMDIQHVTGDKVEILTRDLLEQISIIDSETRKITILPQGPTPRYSFRAHFIAAEMGNTIFLVELIRRHPSLIWNFNDQKQSIFHIAVKYRRHDIYNLLYEIGAMKDWITPHKDAYDNNILHFAGKLAPKERLADVSGPALQMQRELLWFKEVRNMVPPYCREQKNKDGLTPRELFTKEHKELTREGEKWMKETASQCMVVAALIATVVFAAAFTVPGGYNQNDGIPVFYQKAVFVVFVVADAMSLFLSSASILTFLSILTSRYAEHDFLKSLPRKLMLGLLTLFLSIAAMVITFSISFFIFYHKEMKWIPILMSVVALMPVLLYVLLQYHVLADVIRSSYGSRYLFKPDNQVLYQVRTKPQDISIVAMP